MVCNNLGKKYEAVSDTKNYLRRSCMIGYPKLRARGAIHEPKD